ncbi:glycosyltransferase family 4 protein [Thermodesulfobacteriota bacterium]
MYKIVHIITRLDMGGSAQNTLLTCIGLSGKYDLVLAHGLSLESYMTELEQKNVDHQINAAKHKGVTIISIPPLVRKIDPCQDIRAFISLWRLIRREKPVIVHTHSAKAGILGRLAAKISNVPVIIHTPHGHVFFGHFGFLASKLFLLMEKIFDRLTDCVVALTEGEKKDYLKFSVSKKEKIVTIHSGVHINQFANAKININEKKKALGLKPTDPTVGTVGWLLPIKGPTYLLEAMADVWQTYPEVQLVFVGKGELEEKLKADALRMGAAEKVSFLGWRDDIPEIMQIFDIFVLPSLNEGMGRVLVEAMAAGKAVVASNVGGVPDLVKHGQNGFLAKPGDARDLSGWIEKLLLDKKMRAEMGAKGEALSRNFSVEKMVDKIDKLYFSLFKKVTAW